MRNHKLIPGEVYQVSVSYKSIPSGATPTHTRDRTPGSPGMTLMYPMEFVEQVGQRCLMLRWHRDLVTGERVGKSWYCRVKRADVGCKWADRKHAQSSMIERGVA